VFFWHLTDLRGAVMQRLVLKLTNARLAMVEEFFTML
jgi:hypothetical protein